jgi:genome maintenance exonuclease 1
MIQKTFKHNFTLAERDISATESTFGRSYVTEDGTFPSVTTVVGWEKQAFFKTWRKQNPEEAKRVTSRGNRLHSTIEKYLRNENIASLELMPNDLELFVQIKENLDKIDNIKALEFPLFGKTVGLAGRVDCIAEYDGKLSIIDFKASSKEKRESDIDNYFAQATAYALMYQERTNTIIENFAILIACEDGLRQVFQGNPLQYVRHLSKLVKRYKEAHYV